jgi:hypothetical protein
LAGKKAGARQVAHRALQLIARSIICRAGGQHRLDELRNCQVVVWMQGKDVFEYRILKAVASIFQDTVLTRFGAGVVEKRRIAEVLASALGRLFSSCWLWGKSGREH